MTKMAPYFYSENALEQASFYVSALGGEIHYYLTYGDVPGTDESMKDKVIHMSFTAGGVNFYIADTTQASAVGNNGCDLTLEFATEQEAQEAFLKLSEGGSVLMTYEKQFWGTRFGRLQDKYGIKWQITSTPQS